MLSPSRKYKDTIYEQFARIGKAISSPRRLELLDLLCQGPRTVEVLARDANQSISNTSQHLRVVRAARLVETEKQGLFVTYLLADEHVCEFYRTLRTLAESRFADIQRVTRDFLEQRGALEPVDQTALLERVKSGEVTVLDVRPAEEYRAGHIPGSISVPLEELEQHLADLPRSGEIVAYCRGPYCVLAVRAVELLRARGFTAVRLEDGVPDWRAHGFDVAVGEKPA
ncbi:MAG: metalloregulator ArsR/SmtB family transcription factor [Chitinivibrionia bacterium]|nr:metalloregulator ArsR/SmtB family transcription factor [Chitinivibrionia bacterium]